MAVGFGTRQAEDEEARAEVDVSPLCYCQHGSLDEKRACQAGPVWGIMAC